MFRVSGEVEYNLSVILALRSQLRPRVPPSATSRASVGAQGNCMDRQGVSQHRFMSGIEI